MPAYKYDALDAVDREDLDIHRSRRETGQFLGEVMEMRRFEMGVQSVA